MSQSVSKSKRAINTVFGELSINGKTTCLEGETCFCHVQSDTLHVSVLSSTQDLELEGRLSDEYDFLLFESDARPIYRWCNLDEPDISMLQSVPAGSSVRMRLRADCPRIAVRLHADETLPIADETSQMACWRLCRLTSEMVRQIHFSTSLKRSRQQLLEYRQGLSAILRGDLVERAGASARSTATRISRLLRAMEFMHVEREWEYSIESLAALSNQSVRSFYYQFKQFTGITPYQYFLNIRLSMARLQLFRGSDSESIISEVAVNCGFNHLGRFVRKYNALFGELPSATLLADCSLLHGR